MKVNERTGVTTWFETDPDGVPMDGCEFRLIELDTDPGRLRIAWFDSYHSTGGNRALNEDQVKGMLDALIEFREKRRKDDE